MKKAALTLLLLCMFVTGARADVASWTALGRINDIAIITHPDNNKTVEITLNVWVAEDANFRQVTFECGGYLSCTTALLGSCTKASLTTVSSDSEGTTTREVWQCVNPHYANCKLFSGYMIPQFFATSATANSGCLY